MGMIQTASHNSETRSTIVASTGKEFHHITRLLELIYKTEALEETQITFDDLIWMTELLIQNGWDVEKTILDCQNDKGGLFLSAEPLSKKDFDLKAIFDHCEEGMIFPSELVEGLKSEGFEYELP